VLLTISTTRRPATDLGYLLHKHPDRAQSFSQPFGEARVFYPEASEERCTAALLLNVDPVGLVRRGRRAGGFALAEYVNDRPYVASSFMSVAMVSVFKSAMAGTCKGHEELAAAAIPLEAWLPVVPARGGAELARQLFEPLGYAVEARELELDPEFPDWGADRHLELRLTGELRLADLLTHVYVLLPVLDDEKHYWVDDAEIDKLMRRGEGWLPSHPERELIVRRYLKNQASLFHPALAQLEEAGGSEADEDDEAGEDGDGAAESGADAGASGGAATADGGGAAASRAPDDAPALREQRLDAVVAALEESGARRVLDLGCGSGALLRRLLAGPYEKVVGADVSVRALEGAARRLDLDTMHEAERARIELLQSPLTYRDRRLAGFDAAALVEVIEHLDPPRLGALERNVFADARPGTVVVTTPNAEYNVRWPGVGDGMRHPDHRFEWTRAEFAAWADAVAARNGYEVRRAPVGPEDPEVGAPTQMAVFSR
jgi:3' terminal RNA ribose 2'-O-methyltransferase Hen1